MKRPVRLMVALVMAAGVFIGPLAAQMASPGSQLDSLAARLPKDPSKVTPAQAMQIMDRFGQCLVSMQARLATVAIAPAPKPEALKKALNDEDANGCLQGSSGYVMGIGYNLELLRGSVFKALYKDKYSRARPAFMPQALDWTPHVAAMNAETAKRFIIFHKLAECTLAAAPEPAHEVIIANFDSERHRAAFTRLAPAIGDCLPEGLQLELPRQALAGALAEVAYRSAQPSGS